MQNAIHFIGFKGPQDQHFQNAVRIFGYPDFVHRVWDIRAQQEIMDGDIAIFATGDDTQAISPYTYDDSAQQ